MTVQHASSAARPRRVGAGSRGCGWVSVVLVGIVLVLGVQPLLAGSVGRGGVADGSARNQKVILVPLSKSRVVDLRYTVARVSVADPAICDIVVVNPRQLYLVGKQLGTTNMTLWDDQDQVKDMMSIEVTHDIQTLKQKLYQMLPGEDVRVQSSQGAIVLSGEVSSAPKMAAALQIAGQYAQPASSQARIGLPGSGQGNVINLMQVGGAQQVLLEVKVAEIYRSLSKSMDIDFAGIYNGGDIRIGAVNGGATFPAAELPTADYGFSNIVPFPTPPSGLAGPAFTEFKPEVGSIANTGSVASVLSGNFFFNVVLDIAQQDGLAKILAEPNLTTLSGQEADFISGGEFPVPVPGEDGDTTIEFKKYGIELSFVPTVLDSGLINLQVKVAVSELSSEAALTLTTAGSSAQTPVPSLRTRGANATLEIPSGQTLAIAGLLSENLTSGVEKFPGLGNLPVLGALFRSQAYKKNQTELMIFVTPRLARPFDTKLVKLPTDHFIEPSDTEFYLMGRLEGRRPGEGSSASRDMLGPDKTGSEGFFGHDL